MNGKSLQYQLAESIKFIFKDSYIKKIDQDNFLDINLPSIYSSQGCHLFFNTAKGRIKLGFYVRESEFIEKVISKSSKNIESYSQGLRLIGNPEFETVEQAIAAAKEFLIAIDLTIAIPKNITKASKPKKKVRAKPLQVKPNKEDLLFESKESICENLSIITPNENSVKINWFTRILMLIGELFRK